MQALSQKLLDVVTTLGFSGERGYVLFKADRSAVGDLPDELVKALRGPLGDTFPLLVVVAGSADGEMLTALIERIREFMARHGHNAVTETKGEKCAVFTATCDSVETDELGSALWQRN